MKKTNLKLVFAFDCGVDMVWYWPTGIIIGASEFGGQI